MAQSLFKNPFLSSAAVLSGGAVGNGTLTVNRLTHHSINQSYTVICTATSPFTVFKVIASLDGAVGVAIVGTEFVDPDLKVYLTINQGSTLFAVGDTFTFTVAQGTDLNQENIDLYDELPQKNFSAGVLGSNSGDDNLRFTAAGILAHLKSGDLTFVSKLTADDGNDISIQYLSGTSLSKASKTIGPLYYQADVAGSAGNSIQIQYQDWFPGALAQLTWETLTFQALSVGVAGNSIRVYIEGGALSSAPVVSVSGSDITVQVQLGATLAQDVADAINHDSLASLIIAAFNSDVLHVVATAMTGLTNLAGGLNTIASAGNEIVTVTTNLINVRLQNGVSTATQVKTAVDAYPAAAALVDTTIVGSPTATISAPMAATNLVGGQDTAGDPGNEIVTVNDNQIQVRHTGSTATQIKTAIEASVLANALVTVTVSGTGSTVQTTPLARQFLSGGCAAETYETNVDELSAPNTFYEGNGNLITRRMMVQEKLHVRDNASLKRLLSLDDLDSVANDSGDAIPNVQQYINYLILRQKIIVTTSNHKIIRWNAPSLNLSTDIKILFKDSGVTNTLLASGSPFTLNDGDSLYVSLNKNSSVNLTPIIASALPKSLAIFRLVTRVDGKLVWFDNSLQGENEIIRLGQNVDYTNQIMSLLEDGGNITYDPSIAGKITWSADLHVKLLGSNTVITVTASNVTLNDDDIAYIQLDDPIATSTKTLVIAQRSVADVGRADRYWVFHRSGTKIVVRDGTSLVPGETTLIGQTVSSETLAFIGATGETDSTPMYSTSNGATTTDRYVADGDSLVKAIKKLDTRLGVESDLESQDRNYSLVEGGNWNWNLGTNTLSWSASAYVQMAGAAKIRNTILAGSIVLSADSAQCYVTLNRSGTTATNLTVSAADVQGVPVDDNTLVLAYRSANDVYVRGMKLVAGETKPLGAGISNENRTFLGIAAESDSSEPYSTALGGSTANSQVFDSDSLPMAVKRLDTRAGVQKGIANQNVNIRLIEGSDWSWNLGTTTLSWSANAFVQTPGLADSVNTILTSSANLDVDGKVAYVTLNRSGAGGNLTVTVTAIASLTLDDNIYVIARRVGSHVIVGQGLTLNDAETSKLGAVGANRNLSNLSSPTSINQNLLPDSNNARDLGAASTRWNNSYINNANVNTLRKTGASSARYSEETFVDSQTLTSGTSAVLTALNFDTTVWKSAFFDYNIYHTTSGNRRVGRIYISADKDTGATAVNANLVDTYTESGGSVGVSWTWAIVSGIFQLTYTVDGSGNRKILGELKKLMGN
jgi:hypothetical protein